MFDAAIAYHAGQRPRARAFLSPRRSATYRELNDDVNRFAAALRDLGVSRASGVVAVETVHIYRAHVYMLALARLGVASGVIADTRVDLRISERAGETRPGIIRLTADWLAKVQASPPVPIIGPPLGRDDLARVLLTSGTTGVSRRVPLSWGWVVDTGVNALIAYAAGRMGTWVIRTGVESSMGFSLATLCWSIGACVAVGYGDADLPQLMERQPAGLVAMSPAHLAVILRHLPMGFEPKHDWLFVVSGAAMPPTVAREAFRRLGSDILVNYGATEVGRMFVGHARILDEHPGAVGWPVPGVIAELLGPDGHTVPDGEIGELRIRSDLSAHRYLDETHGETAFRNGWFHPGDLARRLPDSGMFVIEGRIDERMTIGGLKLLPNGLETAVLGHPQVRDAAAFAAPGPRGIDECWIAVVADGEVSRESLVNLLRAAPGPTPPVRFAWAEEIPRNAMGKVDRAALKERTLAALKAPPE